MNFSYYCQPSSCAESYFYLNKHEKFRNIFVMKNWVVYSRFAVDKPIFVSRTHTLNPQFIIIKMFFRSIKYHHWQDSHIQVHVAIFSHRTRREKSLQWQRDNKSIWSIWKMTSSAVVTSTQGKIYTFALFWHCLCHVWASLVDEKLFATAIIGYVCNVNILIIGVWPRGGLWISFIGLINGMHFCFFCFILSTRN
jgi:hypothetical protein